MHVLYAKWRFPAVMAALLGGLVLVAERSSAQVPPDFVEVDKQPVPVTKVNPEYPEAARTSGAEGTVWVKIWVDTYGKARKAVVMKSDNALFNKTTVDAAMRWVFTPAELGHKPVAVWVTVPFRFKLDR